MIFTINPLDGFVFVFTPRHIIRHISSSELADVLLRSVAINRKTRSTTWHAFHERSSLALSLTSRAQSHLQSSVSTPELTSLSPSAISNRKMPERPVQLYISTKSATNPAPTRPCPFVRPNGRDCTKTTTCDGYGQTVLWYAHHHHGPRQGWGWMLGDEADLISRARESDSIQQCALPIDIANPRAARIAQ